MGEHEGDASEREQNRPEDRSAEAEEPTVVGIGTSAGGLAALKTLLANVSQDSGLTYVVVVHLSPEHESHLAELLQPHVKMPVRQVSEDMPLQTGCVYVIPPNRNLNSIDTHLRLSALEARRHERAPIDHFFRTLARSHDGHSVGVVLTGMGSDGTLGLKAIKGQGGLTIVQDPNEAEYDGMPQSALATDLVDLVLPLAAIPDAILRFAQTRPRVPISAETPDGVAQDQELLLNMFAQIRTHTGRDFSRYKRSTILRRTIRRMQLRHVEEWTEYLAILRAEPDEVRALADDLLITVTNFFRDPDVFEVLQKDVIPSLFDRKGPNDDLRVWSVGCATGEEAYSVAMLLLEEAARRETSPRLQVFASDLHELSLTKARDGFYPGDIEADVSAQRLKHFFHKEEGGYRIRKDVRELVVFAPHNLLADPPFSRLDLVLCRNVLIYLQGDVQRDVIELFHYALKPDGVLVLGTSESIAGSELFFTQDKKSCLHLKRNVPAPDPRLPVFPLKRMPGTGLHARMERLGPVGEPLPYGVLHQRIVERYAPPSLLVNPEDKVVHLSEHAGHYLTHPGGEITTHVYKLVREELQFELRAALHTARETGRAARSRPVPVVFEGATRPVVLHVRPSQDAQQEGFALVIFDEQEAEGATEDASEGPALNEVRAREAEDELGRARQRLQAIIEEYETSQEELKASNEELQSSNEELRSTMEELETSKEELQSMNEELQTVNQENRHKVEELAQLTGDLQNLMAATDIATLFLDRDLRILRFTPKITDLFNVRLADRGRPLSDITHCLMDGEILSDAQRVLADLVPIERELVDEEGRWYLTRLRPYRSAEDRIEGVVLTFVDISGRKQAEEGLRQNAERSRLALNAAGMGSFVWYPGEDRTEPDEQMLALFGLTSSNRLTLAEALNALLHPADRDGYEKAVGAALDPAGEGKLHEEIRVFQPDGTARWLDVTARVEFGDTPRRALRMFGVVFDIDERKQTEEALRASEARFREMAETVPDVLFTLTAEGGVDYVSGQFEALTGIAPTSMVGKDMWPTLIHADDLEAAQRMWGEVIERRERFEVRYRLRSAEGAYLWVIVRARPVYDQDGTLERWFGTITDVNALTGAEQEVQALNETLEERVEERSRQVRKLAQRLTLAEQEERHRISTILHDELQQLLYGVEMKLVMARKNVSDAEPLTLLDQAAAWVERAVALTRQLTVDLSPPILHKEGLADALEWLQRQMQELHGLTVNIEADHNFCLVNEDLRVLLFQIVRELLFNVKKHAGVAEASVRLVEEQGQFIIHVIDQGTGFELDDSGPPGARKHGFGLTNASERLALLGGEMKIRSGQGEGTHVEIRTPM